MLKKVKFLNVLMMFVCIILYTASALLLFHFYHDKGNIYVGLPLLLLASFILVTILFYLEFANRYRIKNTTFILSLGFILSCYLGIYMYFTKYLHPFVNNSGFDKNHEITTKLTPLILE